MFQVGWFGGGRRPLQAASPATLLHSNIKERFSPMPKITFIGAGSTVFARNLLGDIFSFPELATSTICLFDIDAARLKTSEIVARNVARAAEARPTIEATTDRR